MALDSFSAIPKANIVTPVDAASPCAGAARMNGNTSTTGIRTTTTTTTTTAGSTITDPPCCCCLFTLLPCEVKRRMVSFCSPRDALNVSFASKRLLYDSLNLSVVPARHFFPRRRWSEWHRQEGDKKNESFRIPILHRRTHSIHVKLLWNDQGHGDQKGQIWVIGRPENNDNNNSSSSNSNNHNKRERTNETNSGLSAASSPSSTITSTTSTTTTTATTVKEKNTADETTTTTTERDLKKEFEGGRIVYESPVAPHTQSTLEFDFSPLEGEMYHLWYKVGRGGIHMLTVHEGSVSSLIFDDADRNVATLSKKLLQCNVLSPLDQEEATIPLFYTQLLETCCVSLKEQLSAATASTAAATAAHSTAAAKQQQSQQIIQQHDSIMMAFFRQNGIVLSEKSIAAIQEIMAADQKVRVDIKTDNLARDARRFLLEQQQQQQQQQQQGAAAAAAPVAAGEDRDGPPRRLPPEWGTVRRLHIPVHARQGVQPFMMLRPPNFPHHAGPFQPAPVPPFMMVPPPPPLDDVDIEEDAEFAAAMGANNNNEDADDFFAAGFLPQQQPPPGGGGRGREREREPRGRWVELLREDLAERLPPPPPRRLRGVDRDRDRPDWIRLQRNQQERMLELQQQQQQQRRWQQRQERRFYFRMAQAEQQQQDLLQQQERLHEQIQGRQEQLQEQLQQQEQQHDRPERHPPIPPEAVLAAELQRRNVRRESRLAREVESTMRIRRRRRIRLGQLAQQQQQQQQNNNNNNDHVDEEDDDQVHAGINVEDIDEAQPRVAGEVAAAAVIAGEEAPPPVGRRRRRIVIGPFRDRIHLALRGRDNTQMGDITFDWRNLRSLQEADNRWVVERQEDQQQLQQRENQQVEEQQQQRQEPPPHHPAENHEQQQQQQQPENEGRANIGPEDELLHDEQRGQPNPIGILRTQAWRYPRTNRPSAS